MSDVQTLPFSPLVIGIAGIIAASAAFYFMNKQSPADKDNKPQEPIDLSFADTPQKEIQKRRTKKKKEIIVPPTTTTTPVKEETLPKTKDIIKEDPKPQTESHSAPKKTEQPVKEVKQTTEETKKAKKKKNKNKPSTNNNNNNNEQPKQQQSKQQQKQKQQTLLEDILTGNDDGEWEEIVKYKKSDKDKSRKLQQKIQQQHDEYLSQF